MNLLPFALFLGAGKSFALFYTPRGQPVWERGPKTVVYGLCADSILSCMPCWCKHIGIQPKCTLMQYMSSFRNACRSEKDFAAFALNSNKGMLFIDRPLDVFCRFRLHLHHIKRPLCILHSNKLLNRMQFRKQAKTEKRKNGTGNDNCQLVVSVTWWQHLPSIRKAGKY
jgi:hypothetical protein